MSDQASKPREWTMAESILHFQDGVRAVGPMIHVIEYSAFEAQAQELASLRAALDLEQQAHVETAARLRNERDELEVELAKANTKEFAANLKIDSLKSKLEAAEKEIERLNKYVIAGHEQINSEMKAEVERLRELATEADDKYWSTFNKLEAVQSLSLRYRTALEFYANLTGWDNGKRTNTAVYEVARQALADAPETGPSKDEKCPSCGSTEFRKLHPHSAIRSCLKCNTGWTNAKVTLD